MNSGVDSALGALPSAPPARTATSLLRWVRALGTTAGVIPPAALVRDPLPLLSWWSRAMLRALAIEAVWEQEPPEAVLWVANHLSWVDPLVLMAKRPMSTIAKAEVASYPFVGSAAKRAGLHFVQRDDPNSRASALVSFWQDLGTGRPMLLFPEGTTTRGESLAPFYRGGILAAHHLGIPTLPIRLSCAQAHYPWVEEDELLPHLDALTRVARTRVRLRPGPVLHPSDFPDPEAWIEALQTHLQP